MTEPTYMLLSQAELTVVCNLLQGGVAFISLLPHSWGLSARVITSCLLSLLQPYVLEVVQKVSYPVM